LAGWLARNSEKFQKIPFVQAQATALVKAEDNKESKEKNNPKDRNKPLKGGVDNQEARQKRVDNTTDLRKKNKTKDALKRRQATSQATALVEAEDNKESKEKNKPKNRNKPLKGGIDTQEARQKRVNNNNNLINRHSVANTTDLRKKSREQQLQQKRVGGGGSGSFAGAMPLLL